MIQTPRQPVFFPKRYRSALVFAAWLAIVVTGICAVARHAGTPGPVIHTDRLWPVGDRLPRHPGVATLVMILHPQCPCSRASLNELDVLMSQCQGRLNASVLFVEPVGLTEDSATTDLWKAAAGIAGVQCDHDPHGELASIFGAATSGQVFLYDADGVLQFHGGITASRGHAGDNDGVNAIQAIVNHQEPTTRQTPVFGCSLR